MKIEVDTTSKTVSLNITGTYTPEELLSVLQQIGQARAQISEQPSSPVGMKIETIVNPGYWATFGPTTNNHSLLAWSHPIYGWLGFALPMVESARLAKYLNEHLVASITAAGPNQASALLTVEGGGVLH